MSKRSLVLLFILILRPAPLPAGEQVQAPVPKDGDFWQFRFSETGRGYRSTALQPGDYELRYTKGRVMAFKISDLRKEQVQGGHATQFRRLLGSWQERLPYLEFPLFEGKEWKTEYTAQVRGTGKGRGNRPQKLITADHRVVGRETITIPAGKFAAFKIKRDTLLPNTIQTWEYFYVVECGCIALFSFEEVTAVYIWPPAYGGKREFTLIKFGSTD